MGLGRIRNAIKRRVEDSKVEGLRSLHRNHLLGIDDLVFVIYPGNKGWILDAICREIAKFFPGKASFHYAFDDYLPAAKAYFFSHYSLLPLCLKKYPWIEKSQLLVYYTHPKSLESDGITDEELYGSMNRASKIICMCSEFVDFLKTKGVRADLLTYVLGGADPQLFSGHVRGSGKVGFSTAYYARKSPDLVLEVIRSMPHRQFLLLGKRWHEYEKFSELENLENFSYIEAPYTEYPRYYSEVDVFVSPAKLEGGPISLIETMMCNAVPVASRTGFSPDLITHGENGFLFDVGSRADVVCDLIDQAFDLQTDIRSTVTHLSWENFSLGIQACLHR